MNKYRHQTKICPVCNREFTNRKKWDDRGQWENIKYCSRRCRNRRKQANNRKEDSEANLKKSGPIKTRCN